MPEALHLDRRAGLLVRVGQEGGEADDLLNTEQLAEWLAVSRQWCEIGRHRGYGPPYLKLTGRVRYRRSDVLAWLIYRPVPVAPARPCMNTALTVLPGCGRGAGP